MGYYLQGGAKFGGYELLKYNIFGRIERAGGGEAVRRWRLPVMMGAAGLAEVAARFSLESGDPIGQAAAHVARSSG